MNIKTSAINFIVVLAIVLTALLSTKALTSCGNKDNRKLNALLLEVAGTDKEISQDDWNRVCAFIVADQDASTQFCDAQGKVDASRLKAYISDFFANRRTPVEVKFAALGDDKPLKVNIYLERSGSMTPYDTPQGDGNMKAAITTMLNALPHGVDGKLYVVNSEINEYPNSLSSFMAERSIFDATKGLGDASYTDFTTIFKKLLNSTKQGELSILFSDLIYSTQNMQDLSPAKIFAEIEGMTNAVFKDQVKEKSILVLKMRGSYHGSYYAYDSPTSGVEYHGLRPYYIVIVGSNEAINRISTDKEYYTFSQFSKLKGFEDEYLFTTSDIYRPYCSFLLEGWHTCGRFRPAHGQGTCVTRLTDVSNDEQSGSVSLALAVDLSQVLASESYKTTIANYEISSTDPISITSIEPINKNNIRATEKDYIGSATHVIHLNIKKFSHSQDVSIRLKNILPGWVDASSTDDDRNVSSPTFARTTFALKYLMHGIYNSYARNTQGDPAYFELKLRLEN